MGVVSPVVRKCWLEGVGAGLVQVTAAALGLGVEVVLAGPEATIPFTSSCIPAHTVFLPLVL